jgi:hypothetical protein
VIEQRSRDVTASPSPGRSGGFTRLADLQNLERPAQAPPTLRLPPAMVAIMTAQWRASFPGGHQHEQGGTIVADRHGDLSIQNIGGERGVLHQHSHLFLPDVKLRDAARYSVVGTFHTHPYDKSGGWATGVSFSGGDMGVLILTSFLLSVVQSGSDLFAFVKTKLTPAYVDKWELHKQSEEEVWMRMKAGQSFAQGSRAMAEGHALRFGFAYYRGSGNVLTRS